MKNHLGPVSFPLVFASLFVLLTLTVVLSHPASAQLAAPNNLRVDISDGTTGQLFVSWDQVSGATYYQLQRSTSPGSGYADVPNCSLSADANNLGTPWVSKICRDNNGGSPTLTPGTTYYYQVRACNTGCGTWTSTTPVPSNIPVTCNNCTSQILPMCSGSPRTCLHAPPKLPACNPPSLKPPNCVYPTSTITPLAQYKSTAYETVAYPTSGTNYKGMLVVGLPGSDESAGRSAWLYIAQNLGFDVISVNYDSRYQQDSICQVNPPNGIQTTMQAAACFTNVSQAKLNFTGPCTPTGGGDIVSCGVVPDGSGNHYTIPVAQDDVVVRISTMLQYLWCNGYTQTHWENYLATGTTCSTTNPTPNWSKIILGGHSQGGDMATFAADKYPINRAINLSAPPQATSVNGTETAASYFADFATGASMTSIRSIYGLVSQNDTTRYNTTPGLGVYQAVWQAIGYNIPANNDAEWTLNVAGNLQPLVCSSTASHNFSTKAAQSPGGGHADPIYIWNEDIFEYMLNNQL